MQMPINIRILMDQNQNFRGFVYIGIVEDKELNKKSAQVAAVGAQMRGPLGLGYVIKLTVCSCERLEVVDRCKLASSLIFSSPC